ncbi:unnamed protein product [Soboliphyme baturini]|uniref:Protein phosphatase inhibitor n=1 Tax=Soboliphyme baturini TaxID=241478 RepID=A0A183J4Q3_9BILA|nr:unnamed protein product [Soboliphyme baturini]
MATRESSPVTAASTKVQVYHKVGPSDGALVVTSQLPSDFLLLTANDEILKEVPSEDCAGPSDTSAPEAVEEDDESEEKQGWELGGRVDVAQRSISQKRRLRRKRLQEMHIKMKRGKFWEIWEMQKEKYDI